MTNNDTAEYSRDPDDANAYRVVTPPAGTASYAAENLVGRVLNNAYRVESVIGAGGMGVVYRATQIALGRPVAVKTILGPTEADSRAVQRFFREARLLSQLNHPNIIHVIDFGTSEPGPIHFMVMEFLVGQPLDVYAAASPRLPIEAIYELMAQLCAGVSAAHSTGIVHRDLKPSNVFLSTVSGSPVPMVKVLDFGLAKAALSDETPSAATRVGTMLGTPGYSSPEQIQGNPTSDPRSDVYGLGAILYYLASGNPPYSGPTFQAVLAKQLTQQPDPLDPEAVGADRAAAFEPVIRKAMALDPADRYSTPSEFMAGLEKACRPDDTPTNRKTPSWVSRFATATTVRPASAKPALSGGGFVARVAAAVTGVAVMTALTGLLLLRPKPGPEVPPNPGATAPGVTSEEIVFGMTGPFNGPNRELGRGVRTGMDLAFRELNDNGGVFGRALRLDVLDDDYNPETAESQAKKLVERPVFGFAGNVGTPTGLKTLQVAADVKRVLFAPYTGARFFRKDPPDRYVFNYRAGYDEETAVIIDYLLTDKQIKPEEIAVFSQKDGYGDAGYAGVEKALKAKGQNPKATTHVRYSRETNDVREAVDELLGKQNTIKAVVMVSTYKPAADFIRRLTDERFRPVFMNVSFVGGTFLADELVGHGPQYAEGVIVTQVVPHPFLSHATAVLRYREMLKKHHPEQNPGFISLEGYLAGTILAAGLKNAGPDLTSDTLVKGFETLDIDLGLGRPVKFTPADHQASHKVWGTVLDKNGQFLELDLD